MAAFRSPEANVLHPHLFRQSYPELLQLMFFQFQGVKTGHYSRCGLTSAKQRTTTLLDMPALLSYSPGAPGHLYSSSALLAHAHEDPQDLFSQVPQAVALLGFFLLGCRTSPLSLVNFLRFLPWVRVSPFFQPV